MYTINGVIKGDAPILFNKMVDSSVLDSGVTGAQPTDAAGRLAEAELKVHRGANGDLVAPPWMFKRVLLDGARQSKLKVGKTSLYMLVNAYVFLNTEPSFGVKDRDFIHEHVGRIPPRTGKAAIIRRPALDTGWTLRFTLSVVNDSLPPSALKDALSVAGSLVGMGSWKPEYGRFVVTEWSVKGLDLAAGKDKTVLTPRNAKTPKVAARA